MCIFFPLGICRLFLFSLTKKPFEPLGQISLKLLTFKTVFLTFLASGCRRAEVHALSYSCTKLVPGFISKTQLSLKGTSSVEPITTPSLAHTLDHVLAEDRLFCPVKCLKAYLMRTNPFREGKRLLLISYQKKKSSDISQNTISGWIRSLSYFIFSNAYKDWLHLQVELLMPSIA